jgi:hypothetical protein
MTNAAARGGRGLAATAGSTGALAVGSVSAQSIATGGSGDAGGTGAAGGGGGAANSTATVTNVATGSSSANATANGGAAYGSSMDGSGGAAMALATAEGSGASGSLTSHAATSEASTQPITNLSASGSASINSSSESESSAKYGGAAPTSVTDVQSISQIVGDPSALAGDAALNANADIKSGFGASPSFYAIGELGGSYTASGTGGEVSTSSVSFTLNQAGISSGESLEFGLCNGDEVDTSGVTGISLTVRGNRTNLLSEPINSASQFTDNAVDLGPLGTSGTLYVDLTLLSIRMPPALGCSPIFFWAIREPRASARRSRCTRGAATN